jgi:hypothetical protein
MRYYDFDAYYTNRDQGVSSEAFYVGKEKKVLRPDLIIDILPGIVQLVLENARWRPPKRCDWIFLGKNEVATWEMYRLGAFKTNLVSINLMPMQDPKLELCQDSNCGLIWVSEYNGARRFRKYVNLRHIKDADISVQSDSGYFVLETLCSRMIKLAKNVGALAEEIDGITNVLYQ